MCYQSVFFIMNLGRLSPFITLSFIVNLLLNRLPSLSFYIFNNSTLKILITLQIIVLTWSYFFFVIVSLRCILVCVLST